MDKLMPFGTIERMTNVRPPVRGAEASPEGWGVDEIYLHGNGYVARSFNSRNRYEFSWSERSLQTEQQLMSAYSHGTYGRGKIYFYLPTTYHTNVLAKSWADPSMVLDHEAPPHRWEAIPEKVDTAFEIPDLPVYSVYYNLENTPAGFPGLDQAMFLPITPGVASTLKLYAHYDYAGDGGLYWAYVGKSGSIMGSPVRVDPADGGPSLEVPLSNGPAASGIAIWVGREGTPGESNSVTLTGLRAMIETDKNGYLVAREESDYRWVSGQGHNGCAFAAHPTNIIHGPHQGGNVSFDVSLREVQ